MTLTSHADTSFWARKFNFVNKIRHQILIRYIQNSATKGCFQTSDKIYVTKSPPPHCASVVQHLALRGRLNATGRFALHFDQDANFMAAYEDYKERLNIQLQN